MIPKIRTVKPELFIHEKLFEAEAAYKLPLRVAFIALFSCCDRDGRFRWQPKRLKLNILPYDDVDFEQVLEALFSSGFIKKYELQGEMYGCIPSWSRHQYINQREPDSKLPAFEDSLQVEVTKSNANNEVPVKSAMVIDVSSTVEICMPGIARACTGGREMERKGGEEEGKRSLAASVTRPSPNMKTDENIFKHLKTILKHSNAKQDDDYTARIGEGSKCQSPPNSFSGIDVCDGGNMHLEGSAELTVMGKGVDTISNISKFSDMQVGLESTLSANKTHPYKDTIINLSQF